MGVLDQRGFPPTWIPHTGGGKPWVTLCSKGEETSSESVTWRLCPFWGKG
jgi:hypothetical protein